MTPQHHDYLITKGDTLPLNTTTLSASNADFDWDGAVGSGQIRIDGYSAKLADLAVTLAADGPLLIINGVLSAIDSDMLIPGVIYKGDIEIQLGPLVLTPHTFSIFVRNDITKP